jgi:hypothetical protein
MDFHKLVNQVAGPESVNPKAKTMDRVHIILAAPNSTNGNPRRVSLLLDSETVLKAVDHGHEGEPRDWPYPVVTVDVGAREYNYWVKEGGEA